MKMDELPPDVASSKPDGHHNRRAGGSDLLSSHDQPPDVSFTKPEGQSQEEYMLWREEVANVPKHWVRTVTACNSHCLFCLDMDTPRNVYLSEEDVKAEILRGRTEMNAWKIILSGGEASLHPLFPEFIRYAREVGYGRIQTVTNGWRYADRDFYEKCVEAGLQEMTFSLHGHTEELHNRLTQHKGSFKRIVQAIRRAARDPRMICSVDVVINKQNVGVLDKIVQLSISLGVTEFDLLHVIPQSAGFDNRDELFYNPRQYLPVLQRVFRLNRHPRFVVWTNRFPVAFLEGMEDLIQDPHKMLDEINGRRFQVRNYLDTGEPLSCRQPERCVHCFIEPYCTTMERAVERQNEQTWEVWDVGADRRALRALPEPLPYGIDKVGVELDTLAELGKLVPRLPPGAGLYLRTKDAAPLPADLGASVILVARTAEQCEVWLTRPLPAQVEEVEVHLNRSTASWMLEHRELLAGLLHKVRVHQPSFEHMKDATENDVREPAFFFRQLGLRVRASGLPPCNVPGAELIEMRAVLPHRVFEQGSGRVSIHQLARYHIEQGYRSKSSRCEDCLVEDRCDGMHINMIRDQGLALLRPMIDGAWLDDARAQLTALHPQPIRRILHGRDPQPAAVSLPGFAQPTSAPADPLAMVADQQRKQREERLAKARELFNPGPGEAK
jgi:pyruvate-formate lyase-activating enzyme